MYQVHSVYSYKITEALAHVKLFNLFLPTLKRLVASFHIFLRGRIISINNPIGTTGTSIEHINGSPKQTSGTRYHCRDRPQRDV